MRERYFEDFAVGEKIRTAGITLTESDIIDFALRYDPQPFHIDRDAAERSVYGGLIASGWHVGALSFRLFIQTGAMYGGGIGSPGIDALRWLRPVRPGDTLCMVATVEDARLSRSRPDRGIVKILYEVLNQHGEVVMDYRAAQLMLRRPHDAQEGGDGHEAGEKRKGGDRNEGALSAASGKEAKA